MPAYFYVEFYKHAADLPVPDLVRRTLEGVLRWGAECKGVRMMPCETPWADPMHRRYGQIEERIIPLQEAQMLLITDLEDWISGDWVGKWGADKHISGVRAMFVYPFEFDDDIMDNPSPPEAHEVDLTFRYSRDDDRITTTLSVWEEYVLMYGRDSTHRRNLRRTLDLIESVYDSTHPFYGWADKEVDAPDRSFEHIEKGRLEVRNFCVVIGNSMISKFTKKHFDNRRLVLRPLGDGGLMVLRPEIGDGEPIWKWEPDDNDGGSWVPFEGHFGSRLQID